MSTMFNCDKFTFNIPYRLKIHIYFYQHNYSVVFLLAKMPRIH